MRGWNRQRPCYDKSAPSCQFMIPVIETERLILRGHRKEDFRDCAEMWARLLRYVGHWEWMGYGFWAIEEKATGAFAGELGFAEVKREMEHPIQGVPEIGWVLAPRTHGQGYATEAVRAVVVWGDRHFDSARTVCLIHPDNLRSVHVAEKCGYKELERTTYKGQPALIFER